MLEEGAVKLFARWRQQHRLKQARRRWINSIEKWLVQEPEEEPTQEAVLGMLFDVAREMQDGDKDAARVVLETVEDTA